MPATPSDTNSTLTPAARRTLDTASRLFYAHGIAGVGVDRIAAEAAVTKKTLYDRFGSKENLVLAYLRERESQWRQVMDEYLGLHPEPGPERVLAVFDAADAWYTGRSTKGCSAVNARAEADAEPGAGGHLIAAEVTSQKTWMLQQFVSLVDAAELTDPQLLGRQLLLLLEGALVTLGTRSFDNPILTARATAAMLLDARRRDAAPPPDTD